MGGKVFKYVKFLLPLVAGLLLGGAAQAQAPAQEQRWFTYQAKGFLGAVAPLKLEVLASEPVAWNGRVVVINHGSTGRGHGSNGYDENRVKTPVKFVRLAPALAARGYRVFVLMRQGRGNSEGPFTEEDARTCAWSDQMRGVAEAEPQLDQFVDWLRQEYRVDRVIVMGHSRGGFLSAYYAARHPDKVAYAVNISGGWTTACEAKNGMTEQMLKDSAGRFKNQTWVYASQDSYFSEGQLAAYAAVAAGNTIPFIKLETTRGDGHAFATANPGLWLDQVEARLDGVNPR